MKTRIITLILFALAMISCKGDKQEEQKEAASIEVIKGNDFFTITLDVVAQNDDSFHVFYSEDKTENFTEQNSVWVEFKGAPSSQKLTFNLPKDRIPTNLRIDFGVNKEQKEVKINNLEIAYQGKKFNLSGFDFFKFFRPNEAITTIDLSTQTIKAKKEGKDYFGASIYSLEPLSKEMENLLK